VLQIAKLGIRLRVTMLSSDQVRHLTNPGERYCYEVLFVVVRVQNLDVSAFQKPGTLGDYPGKTSLRFDYPNRHAEGPQFLSEPALMKYDCM
jgi:hypothetical protein